MKALRADAPVRMVPAPHCERSGVATACMLGVLRLRVRCARKARRPEYAEELQVVLQEKEGSEDA